MNDTVLMVGGPGHGKRWPVKDYKQPIEMQSVSYGTKRTHRYVIEPVTTVDMTNHATHHHIAVDSDLLLHRNLSTRTIMWEANEQALKQYTLDAALKAVAL